MNYDELVFKLNKKELNYYNFYNIDQSIESEAMSRYYLSNPDDNIDKVKQKINVLFIDIELYIDNIGKGIDLNTVSAFPINAITFLCGNIIESYILEIKNINFPKEIDNIINEYKEFLKSNNYIKDDPDIKINVYKSEKKLLDDFWDKVKEIDPTLLSGFNSDNFDYPYIYRRMLELNNNDENYVNEKISNFSSVFYNGKKLDISDYPICDILHLYKPRDEQGNGGMNYGKKQPSYSLNYLSENLLGLKKLEYQTENTDLNSLYEQNIVKFLLYNITDVLLTDLLNKELKHIELHSNIKRIMKTPFSPSIKGNSFLFLSYYYHQILKNNSFVRYGMTNERRIDILSEKIHDIPKQKISDEIISPVDVNSNVVSSIIYRYDGAYVKQSKENIINDGSLLLDFDASSLYPSMKKESNISIDTYLGRIINPLTYNTLSFLEKNLNTTNYNKLYSMIFEAINDAVEKDTLNIKDGTKSITKSELKKYIYSTASYFLKKIQKANVEIDDIYNPKNDKHQLLLNFALIPLLDIVNSIHPKRNFYNEFCLDYVFGENDVYKNLYVILNGNSPNKYIKVLSNKEVVDIINNNCLTFNGCLFKKHDEQLGMGAGLIDYLWLKRKEYDSIGEGLLANSIKILTNADYGVNGLKSFPFSSHDLAQAITSMARMSIISAQILTSKFINANF